VNTVSRGRHTVHCSWPEFYLR